MKHTPLICTLIISLLICTGCVSTSSKGSLAFIEREDNTSVDRPVNQQLLTSIQALRISQKASGPRNTFTYELHGKELSDGDKILLTKLIINNDQRMTINIAPAKGTNKLHQLALSMERAEVLRLYIRHFTKNVKIKFAPKLTNDTINLVTGA